ncbi:MAG TPA: glycosyltransferase family 4 protein [Candidatus Competibacteraceae bacterium]|nr:glycosyltransferase family 4 protein [Candidatus Competibacteraceae bacterium]HQA27363.1 glycosyltransferase family 4 protein [Candidatus Competibacteraceae bacterium]HQD54993.1 glycosyltransferase family 4 protein [Candidatus Competibacteraceae bacterium]
MTIPLVYALHSGNLYGTERMALATLAGLRQHFEPVLLAPPGPALVEAARLGIPGASFAHPRQFAQRLRPWLAQHRRVAFVATGVAHSLIFLALNAWYRRKAIHLHLVHGGTDERLSYGRKRLLNPTAVKLVAVSGFVRERLIAHGVTPAKITVIENFLTDERVDSAPRRPAFTAAGIRNIVVISRIDPIKRVDLLLDALDRAPDLAELSFRILGSGWELDKLRARAAERHPHVHFLGFTEAVAEELAAADLLLHLCPSEPFGLAILEAMAAGVPVLVPDSGGAALLVEDGVSGGRFRADDAEALTARLRELRQAPAEVLNRWVAGGDRALATRFSQTERLADYQGLLAEVEHD